MICLFLTPDTPFFMICIMELFKTSIWISLFFISIIPFRLIMNSLTCWETVIQAKWIYVHFITTINMFFSLFWMVIPLNIFTHWVTCNFVPSSLAVWSVVYWFFIFISSSLLYLGLYSILNVLNMYGCLMLFAKVELIVEYHC